MSFKIDPPFANFMQNGINAGMEELTSKIETNFDDQYVELNKELNSIDTNVSNNEIIEKPKKYKIQSLFWLLNPKLVNNTPLSENEVMFCTINFNVDFGNLRFEFYNIEKETAITRNILFLSEMTKLIDGVIYPTDCFQIANSETTNFYIMEQLVIYTNEDWQKKRPILNIDKNKDSIKLEIESFDNSIKYHYVFENYQKDIFNYCCKYVVTTGLQLNGMAKI